MTSVATDYQRLLRIHDDLKDDLSTLRRVVLEEANGVDKACLSCEGHRGAIERVMLIRCTWPGHAIAARLREAAGGKA